MARLFDGREAQVVAAYEAGATIDDLAARYGCSARPVRGVLLAAGVAIRPAGRRSRVHGREARIAEAYLNGATLDELAAEHGCQPRAIRKVLVAKRVAIRPPGRAPR